MKLIRSSTEAYFKECTARAERIATAYRWLSEFDWLLAPLWEHLNGRMRIEDARTLMQDALKVRLKKEREKNEQG